MNKKPLWVYIAAVVVVFAVINGTAWLADGAHRKTIGIFSLGFLLGMFAMYIKAVYFYNWK